MVNTRFFPILSCALFAVFSNSCDPQAQRKKRAERNSVQQDQTPITDGVVKDYYKEGKLRAEIPYENGKKNGLAREYYKTGIIYQEIEYRNGLKHGLSKRYYENGEPSQVTEYDSGRRHGKLQKFKSDGSLLSVATYFNDEPCKGLVEYLRDGSVKKNYPTIVVTPVNNLLNNEKYTLRFSLSDKSRAVEFFIGELSKEGCITDQPEKVNDLNRDGVAELDIYLPKGMFIMKTITVIAKIKTIQDNYYITTRPYNLSIEHK
jgi:hypothetical protein